MDHRITAGAVSVALALSSSSASAQDWFQLEAGIGGTAYTKSGDGVWWQSGFQHNLNLTAPDFRVGVTGDLWQRGHWGLSYHLDYAWLGTVHTNAQIPTPKTNTTSGHWQGPDFIDYNSSNPCSGPCTNMSDFMGGGHDMGIMATLEPHYDVGAWRFGVEAGPYVHRATWSIDIANWYNSATGQFQSLHVATNPEWKVSWTAGASISRGPFSLRYDYFANGVPMSGSNSVPAGWSAAHMLMATYRF
jgi:opacity protein-like surface antigen